MRISPVSAICARVGDWGRIDHWRGRDDHWGGRDDWSGDDHGGGYGGRIDRRSRVDRWGRGYDVMRKSHRGGRQADDACR